MRPRLTSPLAQLESEPTLGTRSVLDLSKRPQLPCWRCASARERWRVPLRSSRRSVGSMNHLAISVRDEERSRRFYESYFGFGSRPPRRYADGVLMLYNAGGFALALGPADERFVAPSGCTSVSHWPTAGPCSLYATGWHEMASSSWRNGTSRNTSA